MGQYPILEMAERADLGHAQPDSINTVLIFLYGTWGRVEKSRERFETISNEGRRNVLPLNVMITALVQNGSPVEALNLFRQVFWDSNRTSNHIMVVSVLSACAQVGDLVAINFPS